MLRTSRTIRVKNIPWDTSKEAFKLDVEKLVADLRQAWNATLSMSDNQVREFQYTFATDFEEEQKVATITFQKKKQKKVALGIKYKKWKFDDQFDGVTILRSPSNANLDICAVHGLNGNAFETWAEGDSMWLRDFLPSVSSYAKARIMTYGYSSALRDSTTSSTMKDWSQALLIQVSNYRKGLSHRPLIFICYSLGGLVVREAIVRLNEAPYQVPHIELHRCGILFLGTPHSGSSNADWNEFLLACSEVLFGIRRSAIVDQLKTFNTNSEDNLQRFAMISPKIPYKCLCETENVHVALRHRLVRSHSRNTDNTKMLLLSTANKEVFLKIVSRASAGLLGERASPMNHVNHRTMCRFDSADINFRQIIGELDKIYQGIEMISSSTREVLRANMPSISTRDIRAPSEPQLVAPFYPIGTCYEGLPIPFQNQSQIVGRETEINSVHRHLADQRGDGCVRVAITGIGGIGKTELLCEIARLNHGQRNVFYFPVTDGESLDSAYEEMAHRIGPEVLSERIRTVRDFVSDWRTMEPQKRAREFRSWLEGDSNQESFVMVDDLDGLANPKDIRNAFPSSSRVVLYSSRDPFLKVQKLRNLPRVSLSPLSKTETIQIMRAECDLMEHELASLGDSNTLNLVASQIQGNPLVASQAVKYMIEVLSQHPGQSPGHSFLKMCKSTNRASMRRFLTYKASGERSILETFQISMHRLQQKGKNNAWNLMLLISHLQADPSIVDFRNFFFSRPDIEGLPQLKDTDDSSLNEDDGVMEALSELVKVSFCSRNGTSAPEFHPFWLECGRHLISQGRREEYLRYILITCFKCIQYADDNHDENLRGCFLPHIYQYFQITKPDDGSLDALNLPAPIKQWIQRLQISYSPTILCPEHRKKTNMGSYVSQIQCS